MKDYRNVIFDIAKSNGVGRLIVGPNVIPVKVTDIKSDTTLAEHETAFKCLLVDSSALYTDTDKVTADSWANTLNSVYGVIGGRSVGKWKEEYDLMKKNLESGFSIVPIKNTRGWMAKGYVTEYRIEAPKIDKVIFSNPATIVFWTDGEKTVVKCQNGEAYDPEKGLAMAISKRALGNKGNYCKVFNKQLTEGMKNSTPEQFNSEVCHIDKYEDLWEKFRNEVGCTQNALAILNSVIHYKRATKEQIINAVKDAANALSRPKTEDK